MVDVETAVDAPLATERRHPAVARDEQKGRKRCRNTEAMELEESAAISLGGVSHAEHISELVPARLRAGLESAKDPRPKSPQHVPGKSDDVGAAQVTAQSAAAGGSNVPKSSMEHTKTYDISTFPILGFYILSGVCRLCGKTFRAAGGIYKGKARPGSTHARLQHKIIKHARTHA